MTQQRGLVAMARYLLCNANAFRLYPLDQRGHLDETGRFEVRI